MLIGYVSDERYVAIADALLEFERDGKFITQARSTARGGVHADLTLGAFRVAIVKPGFGSKVIELDVTGDHVPYHFRLLSDGLLGYMWPKWVRAGEQSEFRVHSVEAYR